MLGGDNGVEYNSWGLEWNIRPRAYRSKDQKFGDARGHLNSREFIFESLCLSPKISNREFNEVLHFRTSYARRRCSV